MDFRDVDEWLLDHVFQPIAWRVEWRTGVNQFALARASVFIYMVGGAAAGRYLIDVGLPKTAVFSVLLVYTVAFLIYRGSYEAERMAARSGLNPERAISIGTRFIWLFTSAFFVLCMLLSGDYNILMVLDSIGPLGIVLSYYFRACDSAPPPKEVSETELKGYSMA